MKNSSRLTIAGLALAAMLGGVGCTNDTGGPVAPAPTPTPTPAATPTPVLRASELPVTLPLIDALFYADEQFAPRVKEKLELTDEQITRLREVAREETTRLRESEAGDHEGTTTAAGELAMQKVSEVIGEEKAQRLGQLALEMWRDDSAEVAGARPAELPAGGTPNVPLPAAGPGALPSGMPSPAAVPSMPSVSVMPNAVPGDTRVVVNAPAYRMDVFENGQLVKAYKIGIGYPEFPLPEGMRAARSIIFNPTWTPPDEPWVESSRQLKVGQKVPAGDKLNPLGPIKIPIGLPSLIHGGKTPAKIGGFASHGCVGLTDKQVADFSQVLGRLGGVEITEATLEKHAEDRTKTESVKLAQPVPVELRYETIVVEDGKLHVYRDVYDRGTNTEENLRAVLEVYGVQLEDLNEDERALALAALEEMSRDPGGKLSEASAEEKEVQKKKNVSRGRVTRAMKGEKEVVIAVRALAGKGYPAPADLDTGGAPEPKPAKAATRPKRRRP